MKRYLDYLVFLILCLVLIYPIVWILASSEILGEVEFGYYADFYKAKRAIRETGCAEQIEYSRHEDVTLEDFHFKVHTKSGQVVLVWFNEEMNINEVCNKPEGIIVLGPGQGAGGQSYTTEYLSNHLNGKGVQVRNIRDLLCHIRELAPIFEANYGDESIQTLSHSEADSNRYLQILIVKEGEQDSFIYSK